MNIATSELEHLREEVKNCHCIIKDLLKKREFVGLTDEELHQICNSLDYYGDRELVQLIEAKLKQKNGYAEENT